MCPKAEEFYLALKQEEHYNLNTMLLLGILLSNGLSRQKARLIFEIYDCYCVKKLTRADLQQLIADIANLSINVLPTLMDNSTNPPVSSYKAKVYTKSIWEKLNQGQSKLIDFILCDKEDISEKDFAAKFDNDINGRILTPHGFRTYINNEDLN